MLKRIIPKNIIGYRSEEVYGEGYRNIEAVVKHEIEELGNEDIIDTLIGKKVIKNKGELDFYIRRLKSQGYTKVIWLCSSKKAVINIYNVNPISVDKYILKGIIISDLGEEGCLVAYN